MFASEELHFDNKNRFTTFRKFAHPPKVVPHHAPYCIALTKECDLNRKVTIKRRIKCNISMQYVA